MTRVQAIFDFHSEIPKIRGPIFGGPHNEDYSMSTSMLRSLCVGELPFWKVLLGLPEGSLSVAYMG